jgi:spermidine/putrescine transport system permease protein
LLYSPSAVVLTLVHFLLPFAILPIVGSLNGVKDEPIDAARDLGASAVRVVVDVVLPQCQPGIFAAFSISFLISAGDYVTPRLVGGPHTFMVGNFIESQFVNRLNAPMGSALAFAVLVFCLIALFIFRVAMARMLRPR